MELQHQDLQSKLEINQNIPQHSSNYSVQFSFADDLSRLDFINQHDIGFSS